jgi:hypothetical protein
MTEVQGLFVVTNSTINRIVKQDGAFNGSSVLVVKVENWKEVEHWTEVDSMILFIAPCLFRVGPHTPLVTTQQQHSDDE